LPLLGLVILTFAFMEWSLYRAIREQAVKNEAQPADAIVVFGAAEYNGSPSPVLKARLDHAFELEEHGLAPLVITTGGKGGDTKYTEAGVGRDYLVQMGMAGEKILVDEQSESTYESTQAVARLLHAHNGKNCIAVSDGFHLYRIKQMFKAAGITAFGSPDPESPIEAIAFDRTLHSLREALSTSLWYLGYKG
jgi:uncharacterized SAM-binding protein YcdF (DUF218 family)